MLTMSLANHKNIFLNVSWPLSHIVDSLILSWPNLNINFIVIFFVWHFCVNIADDILFYK